MDTPRTRKKKKKIMGKVIKFPAHKVKRKPKELTLAQQQTKEQAQEIKENIFIEQIVEGFTLDLIHLLQDNGVNMKKETFLRDLAIIIEAIKSALKRDFGKNHPMQTITDAISRIHTLPNGKQVTDLNYGKIFVTKKTKEPTPPTVDK